MNIIVNEQHELRAGWKFIAYWVLFLILYFAAGMFVPGSSGPQTQLERLVLNTLPLVPALGALLLMAHFVDGVQAAAFGATLHEHWARDLAVGIGLAVGMLAILTLVLGAAGGITMVWSAGDSTRSSLGVTVGVLLMSAAQEELMFRGYPLQVLIKGMGEWPAILTMSSAFGLGHLLNPNATLLGALNTVLAGLMLSLAYLKTRSLWLAYGLHIGWNIGLGFVLGYPLSGFLIDSFWKTTAAGPRWLVGSEYGPEGGIIGTIVFVVAIIAIRKTHAAGISPKLHALLAPAAGNAEILPQALEEKL